MRVGSSGAVNENATELAPQSSTPTIRRSATSSVYTAAAPSGAWSQRALAGNVARSGTSTVGWRPLAVISSSWSACEISGASQPIVTS
ncbi:MAG: hypothetical protein NT062_27610 [Proteobacteria bacterium]|nr:hypothetical protein [Pseudomonadota bacterium]